MTAVAAEAKWGKPEPGQIPCCRECQPSLSTYPKLLLWGTAPSYPSVYDMRHKRSDQAEQLGQPRLETGALNNPQLLK